MSVIINELSKADKSVKQKLQEVIEKSMEELLPGVKTNAVVTFCDNNYIKELNSQFRNIDSETDVLSFPLLMSDSPGEVIYSPLDRDPETGELMLGDIVISVEKAKEQAEEYGHSLEREICYLGVHSVLHLMGYDHMEEDDKRQMREKEEEILKMLGVER